MSPRTLPKPTDAELDILRVLWDRGPSTVRDVHTVLAAARDVGYTTILKLLQIMNDKGLVTRDASKRTHVFTASQHQTSTQSQLIGHLAKQAFGGSPAKLAMQALSSQRASAEELAEIRQLLADLEEEQL